MRSLWAHFSLYLLCQLNVELTVPPRRTDHLYHSLCGPLVKLFLKLGIPDLQLASCGGFSDLQEVEKSQGSE